MKLTQDQIDHAERLRGACLHCARDEERQSDLFGLELADGQYMENPDREEVEQHVRSQVENVYRVIMHLYDGRWKETQDAAEAA